MSSMCRVSKSRRCLTMFVLSLVSLGLVLPTSAASVAAAEKDSLRWVSADAAFYGSSRRMKEQIQIVAKSKAWAKFRSIPSVKQLWQMVEAQLNDPASPAAVVKTLSDLPENKQLLQLLGDMLSDEIVVYGEQDWVGFYDLVMKLSNSMNTAPLAALAGGDDPDELMARQIFQILSENLDLIQVPTTVVAFKLSATVPAETQLKRLEVLTRLALAEFAKEEPKLKNVLENAIVRTKIGGVDYLTFTLDGKHVPWDEIPFDRIEKKKGQFDKLVAKLKSLKIVVSLGVRDDYLLLSIGGSNEHLARFGKGKLLVDRKEFAPYRKMATRRICSIAYISEAFMQRIAYGTNDIDGLVQLANQALPLANLDAKIEKEIRVDLRKLATQFKDSIPKPGATLTFSFLTNKGYEGYSYNWAENQYLDGSKRLSLLDHVGGSPLMAFVGRSKYSPEQYKTLVFWLKKGYGYFEKLALPMMDAKDRKKFDQIANQLYPLVRRLDKTTGQMLLPALADGQMAFVLDAKMTSKQWTQHAPPTPEALPMIEPALVLGVSDAPLLKKAFVQYRSILNDTLAKLHEIAPDEVPELKMPELLSLKVPGGKLYYYPLPAAAKLDKQIMPNAGLSESVATIAVSTSHSKRLLAKSPLKASGPLANTNRPLAAAVYLNWAGIMDTATPWIELGIRALESEGVFGASPIGLELLNAETKAQGTLVAAKEDSPAMKFVLGQVRAGIEILKCFRGYESVTYREGDAWVTHSEAHFKDLQ